EPFAVGLHHEAEDGAALFLLGPDDGDLGARAAGDPALHTGDDVVVADLAYARAHRTRVGAGIGFGEPEAAHRFAAGQAWQPGVLQGVRAVAVDGVHDQTRLHADEGPEARIGVLDLPTDEAIRAVGGFCAAVPFRQGHTQRTQVTEASCQVFREDALEPPVADVFQQFAAHVLAHAVADHPLFARVQRVDVVEVLQRHGAARRVGRHRPPPDRVGAVSAVPEELLEGVLFRGPLRGVVALPVEGDPFG